MERTCIALLFIAMFTARIWAAEEGLVAYWDFNEGKSNLLHDRSGRGSHGKIIGGAEWARGAFGMALDLNGKDGFVDGGTAESLNIASGGTVMLWCYPKTLQGGLVNWSTGGGWSDERLILAINTYHRGADPICAMADGAGYTSFSIGEIERNTWKHIALAFDGETVWVYNDGVLVNRRPQTIIPKIAGVPMWVGKCLGLGESFFHGMIDDVRIYSRPLSAKEIVAHYLKEGKRRGKDLDVFNRPEVSALAYPAPGKIVVTIDSRAMQFAHDVRSVRVYLSPTGKTIDAAELSEIGSTEVVFDVKDAPPGDYKIEAIALGAKNNPIGEGGATEVKWQGAPKAFKGVKILNNLCWELLEVKGDALIGESQRFTLPIDRWVFIRTKANAPAGGEARVRIENDPVGRPAIVHTKSGTLEAMRYLKAGAHTLNIARSGGAAVEQLTVRSIPALQHAFYGTMPHVAAYGRYDWEMLSKYVLPNVNVMISSGNPKPEHIAKWKGMGRSWISITNIFIPDLKTDAPDAVEKVFNHWSSNPGYQHPLMDGVIVDELGGGDGIEYDIYREAVERLNATFKDRIYMPYGGRFYNNDRSTKFALAALDGGGYLCPEHYLTEQPSREKAEQFIRNRLLSNMPKWEKAIQGVLPRIIVVLGYMSQPTESLNVNPSVNYKVYMDMQVRALATHPACFGLGGIQEYHSAYCDEENVRWAARLYRHYCIEGKTDAATRDPYLLTHIRNPDFADGVEGWTIEPAKTGSIRAGEHSGYSWLEGRYPRTKRGDTFLLMKRSADNPNIFSQEIKNLAPGRLYSMKMITADYQDLVHEMSDKKQNAVSIRLDNVEVSTDPKQNFQFTFPNCYAHHLGKFDARYNYWMNYHWRVFRAKGKAAKLTVTDWNSGDDPGGPIGQELMFNFIEIQPYMGE